jgi:small multidrug resistance pump
MWFWLAGAILAEVTGTIALKLSAGFTRMWPSLVVVVTYGTAFYSLAQALVRGVPIGVAYGIWSAAGTALIALIGVLAFRESLSVVQIGGIALVIGGVLALELG